MTSSGGRAADAPAAGAIELPTRTVSPLAAVTSRMLLAAGLLALCTLLVYLGRNGYHDAAHPGQPLSPLASVYYATVTMSTTGYGDIVPVSDTARLVNTVVITPLRVIFLVILVGTTLEVLTERTRRNWRNTRWRSRVTGHAIVVGYGTKGRSVIATLRESGLPVSLDRGDRPRGRGGGRGERGRAGRGGRRRHPARRAGPGGSGPRRPGRHRREPG